MQKSLHLLREHRRAVRAPLIVALVLLGGCGSSNSSTSTSTSSAASTTAPLCPAGQPACVSQSPKAKASGPRAVEANIIQSMARTEPMLKRVKLDCPRASGYPIRCHLSATQTDAKNTLPVIGTATVLGVDTRTKTYAYELNYAPSRR